MTSRATHRQDRQLLRFIAPAGFNGGVILQNNSGFTTDYNGVELQLTKRLSNRWMAHGSVAYTNWQQNVSGSNSCLGTATSWKGPTNVLTSGGASCGDGVQNFQQSLGSGSKGDVFLSSKWQFNISGLYQLPLNFNIAANLFGRQGYLLPYYASVSGARTRGSSLDALGSRSVIVGNSDNHRLKDVYQLDLRVEKVLPLFQKADLTLSIDMFNALNNDVIIQQSAQLSGRLPAARPIRTTSCPGKGNRVEERMSPRVLRFGARLSF